MADEFLQSLVLTMEQAGGVGLHITLSVNGVVISGALASEEEYIRGLALDFEKRRPGGNKEATEPSEESIKTFEVLFSRKKREAGKPPEYFHLAETVIHQGGPDTGIAGDWWRGRLEEVDGFQLRRPTSNLRRSI